MLHTGSVVPGEVGGGVAARSWSSLVVSRGSDLRERRDDCRRAPLAVVRPPPFYTSGLIAASCVGVTVQRELGHSIATTLNTYSHLWPPHRPHRPHSKGRRRANGVNLERANTYASTCVTRLFVSRFSHLPGSFRRPGTRAGPSGPALWLRHHEFGRWITPCASESVPANWQAASAASRTCRRASPTKGGYLRLRGVTMMICLANSFRTMSTAP